MVQVASIIHIHREAIERVRRVAVHVSSRERFRNWARQARRADHDRPSRLLVLVLVECLLRSASNPYKGQRRVEHPHVCAGEPGARDVLRLDLMELPPLRAS